MGKFIIDYRIDGQLIITAENIDEAERIFRELDSDSLINGLFMDAIFIDDISKE